MAPPMNTATAIDLNPILQQTGLMLPARESVTLAAEARLRLLNILQTSLYLDEILNMFYDELSSLLRINGMQYVNEVLNIHVHHGMHEVHHCAYRLITQSDNLGEIILFRETRFNDQELETLESVLSTLLSPIRNALLYRVALAASLTDPLTGAGNRSALLNSLHRELALARRTGLELSVLVIDIDKFKYINDTHGHGVGDLVLQQLVGVITKVNRSSDLCFRFGGEEFVVLLSNTNKNGAEIIANRLCEAIAETHICTDQGSIQISVSIGAASNCETDTEESLINRADRAMYEVKRRGGNNASWL